MPEECAESIREGGGLCPLAATPSSRVALRVTEDAAASCAAREKVHSLQELCPCTPHPFLIRPASSSVLTHVLTPRVARHVLRNREVRGWSRDGRHLAIG